MTLQDLLSWEREEIIDDALDAVSRAHLESYERQEPVTTREWFERLYDVTSTGVSSKSAARVVEFAERLANERFSGGFDLIEVQTAINVLEEAIWKKVVQHIDPGDLAEALGLISTVLGMGKDALARRYVSLATRTHVGSIDERALFKGTCPR